MSRWYVNDEMQDANTRTGDLPISVKIVIGLIGIVHTMGRVPRQNFNVRYPKRHRVPPLNNGTIPLHGNRPPSGACAGIFTYHTGDLPISVKIVIGLIGIVHTMGRVPRQNFNVRFGIKNGRREIQNDIASLP
jgi:hypothetical protein